MAENKCCGGKGVEPNKANTSGRCLECGAERFGIDPVAQEHFDRTGEFIRPV